LKILVVGSFMMDMVVRTPRVPEMGETIIGNSFLRVPGGKGANQAVAASRLQGDVVMAGKLGNDIFADEFLEILRNEGIDTQYVLRDSALPTGIGNVTVDETGNNRIIVVPGANLAYQPTDLNAIEDVIQKASVVMLQLEMHMATVEHAVDLAYKYGVPVILNPAPARALSDELLKKVTYLTPNKAEAEQLSDMKICDKKDVKRSADVLLRKGVKNVIITLEKDGAYFANASEERFIPGFEVQPVDTVAAGDSFNGALAVAIVQGKDLKQAVGFANAVGALTVTHQGAIPSLPNLQDVERFIRTHKATQLF
jgi:ribokinase